MSFFNSTTLELVLLFVKLAVVLIWLLLQHRQHGNTLGSVSYTHLTSATYCSKHIVRCTVIPKRYVEKFCNLIALCVFTDLTVWVDIHPSFRESVLKHSSWLRGVIKDANIRGLIKTLVQLKLPTLQSVSSTHLDVYKRQL